MVLCSFHQSYGQEKATITGTVKDSTGARFPGINIQAVKLNTGTTTDEEGRFELEVPPNKSIELHFTYLNSIQRKVTIAPREPGSTYEFNVTLSSELNLEAVEITEQTNPNKTNLEKVDPKTTEMLPSASGSGVQTILKTLPGVGATNELSSGYSVRGGNFDENLVYINNVEIYRPFLVRSGRQEGLSIVNSKLVESINFSAGGFEARYGDRMASVLDIQYKEPTDFGGSAEGSLMGGSAHVEGSSEDHRFTYLMGLRHRNTQYLLNSLDVEGDFRPSYTDFQSYLTYDLTSDWQVNLLTHYGRNNYRLEPESRTTDFGTPNQVLRLNIFFDGNENVRYQTFLNALSTDYTPTPNTKLRFIASSYNTTEEEYFDVLGQYRLSEIDTDPGSEDFQEPKANIGVGSFLNHARNELNANIYNFQHRGEHIWGEKQHELKWGARFQHEQIDDEVREWRMQDSSGYSLPRNPDGAVKLDRFVNNEISLSSNRFMGYVQNTFTLDDTSNTYLTTGVRGHFWDYNNQMLLSPRVQFSFKPNRKHNRKEILRNPDSPDLKQNIKLKASAGFYHQPPFYREFRNRQGRINADIRAQKSYHAVIGSDVMLEIWGRPFKWSTEVYYKHYLDLIPYDIENVRIRYFADNSATGFATGLDMKLNGEFVKGLPSWASISLLQTKENLDSKFYEEGEDPGFIRRPTDQRLQFGIYFQDFLPQFPQYKTFLNFVYGSNLPFSPPNNLPLRNQLEMDPYQRVDIGFSRLIEGGSEKEGWLMNRLENIWISIEILNLFNSQNTVSHFWARDINANQWAIPNYATGRRFNLKVKVDF